MRCRGFSLIELVIAMVLLGILAAVGSSMIGDAMNASMIATRNQSSGSQGRYAMERMVREIREMAYGASGYSITAKTSTSLAFSKENGTAVTITSSGTSLTLLYNPGTTSTLTDQVSSGTFAFAYLDQVGGTTTNNDEIRFVQITMTVANTTTGKSEQLRTRVFLRNAQASAI
jgi:prepilin-type N-terminal cleavage/methylation domain-containing protein